MNVRKSPFSRRSKTSVPDLMTVLDYVRPEIGNAVMVASDALRRAGVRHALVGGLAVGAYGHVRATKDVDFLVGAEAFLEHDGGILTFAPGVPIEVGGVPVDSLPAVGEYEFLSESFAESTESEGIPIVPIEVLVYMKLDAGRRRDLGDVEALIELGIDEDRIRVYLEEHAPQLVWAFDELVAEAEAREDEE